MQLKLFIYLFKNVKAIIVYISTTIRLLYLHFKKIITLKTLSLKFDRNLIFQL